MGKTVSPLAMPDLCPVPEYLDLTDTRWQEPGYAEAVGKAILLLFRAYSALSLLLGDDRARASLRSMADWTSPQRPTKKRDLGYNAELAIAYEVAPNGRKTELIKKVMKRHGKKTNPEQVESARRQSQRIKLRGLTTEEFKAAPEKMRLLYTKLHLVTLLQVPEADGSADSNWFAEHIRELKNLIPDN